MSARTTSLRSEFAGIVAQPQWVFAIALLVAGLVWPVLIVLDVEALKPYQKLTFVIPNPEKDGGYRVRIFPPAREIAFAGHPILGTAWVLRHHAWPEASGPVRLNLAVGQVPVTFEISAEGAELVWFLAPPVSLGAPARRPCCPRVELFGNSE